MELKEISREDYLHYRQSDDAGQILRAYFNNQTGLFISIGDFLSVMKGVLEEHPGLEEDIDKSYPEICRCYDKALHINFLTVDMNNQRILVKMF